MDSRCNFGYVWQVRDYCIVHSDVIELASAGNEIGWIPAETIMMYLFYSPSALPNNNCISFFNRTGNNKTYTTTIMGTVVTSFLLIAVLLGAMVYRLLGRRSQITDGERQKLSTLDIDTGCELKRQTPKTVLFLWIQDEDGLSHQVKQLKSLLSTQCNAKASLFERILYCRIVKVFA